MDLITEPTSFAQIATVPRLTDCAQPFTILLQDTRLCVKNISYMCFLILAGIGCGTEDGEGGFSRDFALFTLENNTGVDPVCTTEPIPISFILTFTADQQEQRSIDVEPDRSAFVNVLVADNESVNVVVQHAMTDMLLADSDVVVRTESRSDTLEEAPRVVRYCTAFDLQFSGF